METDLVQKGSEISGTSTYVYAADCYVTITFSGTIKGDLEKVREQKVMTSTPCSLWCIKTMTGRLRIDSLNNKLTIEGGWESSNTAGLKIYDGKVLLRTIELESGPNHSEGINIVYK